ncbi:unnamed protein product [Prunus brigantina]
MEVPRTQKDIQSLTGRVAALTRFISRATDRCVPFFKALKGGKHHIAWTPECDQAFQDLKNYMSKAPLLSKPLPGEVLLLYLSRRTSVPSLGTASASPCCLSPKAPPILPSARDHGSDESASSAAEKGQAVADFISELTPSVSPLPASPDVSPREPGKSATERFDSSVPLWILHVDGSTNQQGCGAGLVLTTPEGGKIEYALRFSFRTSNNEAEYEALLAGLRLARSMSARQISTHSDSQLIVNQRTADFAAKDASMSAYLSAAHQLLQKFQAYEIRQIPRTENSHADALVRLASEINDKIGRKVPVEILSQYKHSMAFGSEAVVPVEIGEPSYRTETFAPKANEEALALSLDLIEERRAQANLRNEAYKQRVSRYYNSRVRNRSFRIGDWVMRKVSLATKNPTEGTLGPSWEGPYEIIGIQRSGTYRLMDSNGKTLGHPWNVEHLKYYFK